MDYQNANMIEFTANTLKTETVHSRFIQPPEKSNLQDESKIRIKKKRQQDEFYNALGTIIHEYESVILFGSSDAKTELYNILAADRHFAKIRIQVKQTETMTENQQHEFVKEFFTPSIDIKPHVVL